MGKAGVGRFLPLAAALALTGAAAAQPYPPSSYQPPSYQPPSYQPPPPSYGQQPYTPRPSADQCGAGELQYLVGRPTTEIPIPVEPGRRRVVCTTCPMTPERYSFRQTILFDAATGRVTSVTCS